LLASGAVQEADGVWVLPDAEVFGLGAAEVDELSFMVSIGRMTPQVADLVCGLADRGHMVLFRPDEDAPGGAVVYLPSAVSISDLPEDDIFRQPVALVSADDHLQAFAPALSAYQAYHDRVVPKRPPGLWARLRGWMGL
jgi:hypothetical protein